MILLAMASLALAPAPPQGPATNCRAVDGDTIRCGGKSIRLIGIDAPEMPGHCRAGRKCVAGDPFRSKDYLQQLLRRGTTTYRRLGRDWYGRTIAMPITAGKNLSCEQVKSGNAVYVRKWDNRRALYQRCQVVRRNYNYNGTPASGFSSTPIVDTRKSYTRGD